MVHLFKKNGKGPVQSKPSNEPPNEKMKNEQKVPLANDLNQNIQQLKMIYSDCVDVVFRPFTIGTKFQAYFIYIQELSHTDEADEQVLSPLMKANLEDLAVLQHFLIEKMPVSNVQQVDTVTDCVHAISSGNPVILCEGINKGFSVSLAKWEKRSIEEPTAESGIKGPRAGFTESIGTSAAQIRRIIKSPDLKMKSLELGKYTKTKIIISYINGLADPTLIKEVENRLMRIKIDGILESGYIEEFIQDAPFSPFPQLLSTERPDVVSAHLLEGRVTILVDGTPFVMIAPTTFFALMQSHEDYYQHFIIATTIRWLRYMFLIFSLLLPSFYVAITTYHQEMIPTALLLSIASSREPVPFPALVEALIMEISFEALREAGVRLPKQVGAAVSIVGALVIGQAAVQAGLVSAPMVIIVATTGIASFMVPRYAMGVGIRLLRFPIIILSGTLGILGIMLGVIAIAIHLCALRSFGVPYLSPLAPLINGELKDTTLRTPWWKMNTRPHFTGAYNESRQSGNLKPGPDKQGKE